MAVNETEHAFYLSGYYHAVAKMEDILDMYKSNQGRKYLEMMVEGAEKEVGEEAWKEIKGEVASLQSLRLFPDHDSLQQ